MSKPVELIVTNEIHDLAALIERRPAGEQSNAVTPDLMQAVARRLLCSISHDAGLPVVLKLLEAAGVCGGLDGLSQRLTSAREARAADGTAEAPRTAPEAHVPDNVAQAFVDVLRKAFGPGVKVTAVKAEQE